MSSFINKMVLVKEAVRERPCGLDSLGDLLQVVLDLQYEMNNNNKENIIIAEERRRLHNPRKFTAKGLPLARFTPRLNGPMSPGKKSRDGHRGGPTFEAYGCITSASEIGKLFGCLSKEKVHDRIAYLSDRGLLEFKTYEPKYKKQTMKLKPYWYTMLKVTEKGLKFMELYKEMDRMLLKVEEEEVE